VPNGKETVKIDICKLDIGSSKYNAVILNNFCVNGFYVRISKWHLDSVGHNRRQFDESTTNVSIDIVDCQLSISLRNSIVDLLLQN
jgi:hypothetical protein